MSDMFTQLATQARDCYWCKKPKQAESYVMQWEQGAYKTIPLLGGVPAPPDSLCQGHMSEECPICQWMVVLEYHTKEQCDKLASITGKRE